MTAHITLTINILLHIPAVIPTTHWVVTDTGKIEAQPESVFEMRQPHNLVSFMHQEQRTQQISEIHHTLTSFRVKLDESPESEEPDIEAEIYRGDQNCLAAGKPLTQFDLFVSTNVRVESPYIDRIFDKKIKSNVDLLEPTCSNLKPHKFNIDIDKLKGMADRKHLTMQGEVGLVANVLREGKLQLTHYGHFVAEAIAQEKTNWVAYYMAANYWRIKGNAPEAIECLRKCIYHGPSEARTVSVPLVSLGNILHHCKRSEDAAALLEMAIDHDPQNSISHYTLGNIYAVLMHYNKSVSSFTYANRLSPDLPWIEKRHAAVKCHQRLERSLEDQHSQLQATLKELRQYQSQHALWTKLNDKQMTEQANVESRMASKLAYEGFKSMVSGKNTQPQTCYEVTKSGVKSIKCVFSKMPTSSKSKEKIIVDEVDMVLQDSQVEKQEVESETETENKKKMDRNVPTKTRKYPKYEDPNVVREYEDSAWPSREDCTTHVSRFPDWAQLPTVYLPPENKGFDIAKIVHEDIGLKAGEAHPLPWYPPTCENAKAQRPSKYLNLPGSKPAGGRSRFPDENIKVAFLVSLGLDHVEDNIAELGARIKTAIKSNIWPKWLTYTLAATYWRVVGNAAAGIDCYLVALADVPDLYRDVVLTNLGALFYRTGHVDSALTLLQEAESVCDTEPETHHFLANLYSAKGNMSGSIKHHRAALKLEPKFPGGLYQLRIPACYIKFHSSSSSSKSECRTYTKEGESCGGPSPVSCGSCGQPQPGACSPGAAAHSQKHPEINAEHLNRNSLTSIQGTDDYILCREGHCEFVTQADVDSMYAEEGKRKVEKCEDNFKPDLTFNPPKPNKDGSCPSGHVAANLVMDTEDNIEHKPGDVHLIHRNEIGELPTGAVEIATIAETIDGVEPPIENIGRLSVKEMMKEIAQRSVEDDPLPDILLKFEVRAKNTVYKATAAECEKMKPVNWNAFTSTWLSVTAKKVRDTDKGFIDSLPEPAQSNHMDPVCTETPVSMLSLDHLSGVKQRKNLKFIAEVGLKEAFKQLTGNKDTGKEGVSLMATRIARGLRKEPNSWVMSTAAALYWRVKGDALQAIRCLRHALYYAPHQMRDIPLVSLANIFHRSGLYNDAIITTNMALEISPKFVVIHFTMANIYASKKDIPMAKEFYKSALTLQSTFEPAYHRLMSIVCNKNSGSIGTRL